MDLVALGVPRAEALRQIDISGEAAMITVASDESNDESLLDGCKYLSVDDLISLGVPQAAASDAMHADPSSSTEDTDVDNKEKDGGSDGNSRGRSDGSLARVFLLSRIQWKSLFL